ncbi:MAG TPA: DegV family protein, partial [Acidimicrobiales bacterium]|nr:DegV family protein [Acidimicrobiales bacterium]
MIRVVTDSACDLPQDLVDELGIDIVPLTIRFGSEELVDRRDLTPAQFWARCTSSPTLPETAAPAPGAFKEAYERAAAAGADGVVCATLSSELSATWQAAVTAAEESPVPVKVVDTRCLTVGEGIMTVAAAKAAREGKSLDDVAGIVADLVPRTRVYGTLDTLEYLRRGGRIGGAAAFLGSILSMKPIVEVADGKVEGESRQRTRARALRYIVDKVRQSTEASPIENLAVMNGAAPDVEQFLDMLAPYYPRDQIIVGDLGAVIGTHTG